MYFVAFLTGEGAAQVQTVAVAWTVYGIHHRAFGAPAESTILVNIVENDAYMRVQARYSSVREIVVIAGPALGGALVALSEVAAFTRIRPGRRSLHSIATDRT